MVHASGVRPGWFHPILRSSDVPGYRVRSIRMLSKSSGSSLPGDRVKIGSTPEAVSSLRVVLIDQAS
jgi:hypothetical protein